MDIEIRYKTVGLWNENSYCLYVGDKSILIDPGDDYDALKTKFQKLDFKFHSDRSEKLEFEKKQRSNSGLFRVVLTKKSCFSMRKYA